MSSVKRRNKKKFHSKSPNVRMSAPVDELSTADILGDQNQQEVETQKVEINDISPEDIEEAIKLIKEIPDLASNVSDVILNVSKRIENGELQMQKGLSFFHLKNLNMLGYITNVAYIILRKLNGKKIENDPAIKRLVELRVVMEKMRPIEDKLKYEINKLLASTLSDNIDTNDPMKFRANPDNFLAQDGGGDDDEDEVEDAAEERHKESNVYVPPKISATYYDEENVLEKKKKVLEHAQKRALSSRMLQELRQEYDTGPEEIKETVDPYKVKLREDLQERKRFEEDFMSRLPMTKKQRHELRQLTTVTNFDTGFEDISVSDKAPNSMQLKRKSKWKKGKPKNKKKKGFSKKH